MNIITKKVRLIPATFVGTRIKIRVSEEDADRGFGIRIAKIAEGSSDATVDWGDGVVETLVPKESHEYRQAGTYDIRLSDDISEIAISISASGSLIYTSTAPKVLEFMSNATKLNRLSGYCFNHCINLERLCCPNIASMSSSVFKDCSRLSGRLDFPALEEVSGTESTLPFVNCTAIDEIHFAEANEEKLMTCDVFKKVQEHHLGAVNAVIKFDL